MIHQQPNSIGGGVIISAVSHEGLSVTVDGCPARLAVVTDDGKVIACGQDVAREAEAVAVSSYKHTMQGKGFFRVLSKPIDAPK
jgi:citrate lyase synthetase